MKAFHGDEAVKQKYLARLKAHHEADEIIQGQGWDGSRGCAVGCTLNKYDHEAYQNELGLPQWLAHLEDRIFEGLPPIEAQRFAVDFLEAVPVGAGVEKVKWQLAVQRHTRDRDRLLSNQERYAKQCAGALDLAIAYCESQLAGTATEEARLATWSATWSAAESAWSARASAATWSAATTWSATESATESAESAAWSAAWSAAARSAARSAAESARSAAESARSAARSDHFTWEAETLLALLRNAPQAAE